MEGMGRGKRNADRLMSHKIIVFSHNRPLYLRQTIESLIYSLKGDKSNIVLVIQDPDPDTLAYAGKSGLEVLETKDNCIFAGMTIAIRWFNPTTVSIVQDDQIFPPMTRVRYPNWPYMFEGMLDRCDVVLFNMSLINLPCEPCFPIHQATRVDDKFEYFDNPATEPPVYLFQPCTMTTAFWNQCYDPGCKCAVDSTILTNAKRLIRTKLEVLHIGWNRDMNGYNTQKEWAQGFQLPFEKTTVTNWKTGEVREIVL